MAEATSGGNRVARRLGALGGRTLALIAVILLAIMVGYRLDLRVDASADGRFSLAPELVTIAEETTADTTIVALWSLTGEDALDDGFHDFLATRLQRVAELDEALHYRHVDSVADQPELAALRERHGDLVDRSIYVIGQGTPFRIPVTTRLRVTLQRELAGALVTAATRDRPPIYVLQGHGELPVTGTGSDTLGHVIRRLELAGMRFDPATGVLDEATLSRRNDIYGDGLLIIAGPTAPLGEDTSAKVHAYLRDGGALLAFLDHRCPDDLALVLRRWGVLVAGGMLPRGPQALELLRTQTASDHEVVVRSLEDSKRDARRDFSTLLLDAQRNIADSAITKQTIATGQNLVSPLSTPVVVQDWASQARRMAEREEAPASYVEALEALGTPALRVREPLLVIPPGAGWVAHPDQRQVPPQNEGPTLVLGLALEWQPHRRSANPERGARLALWASRGAARDRWVADPLYANDLLIADLAAWALDRGATTPIADQQFAQYQVDASSGGLTLILALLVAVVPCLCLGAAMLTWWDRR